MDFISEFKEKWSTWGTGKKVGSVCGTLCIFLVIIFLAVSFLLPDANFTYNYYAQRGNEADFGDFSLTLPGGAVEDSKHSQNGQNIYHANISRNAVEIYIAPLAVSFEEGAANLKSAGYSELEPVRGFTVMEMINESDEYYDYTGVCEVNGKLLMISSDSLDSLKEVLNSYEK